MPSTYPNRSSRVNQIGGGHSAPKDLTTTRCGRCGMTFRVERPAHPSRVETTRCAEPGCGRRFWHNKLPGNLARVGEWPKDVEAA